MLSRSMVLATVVTVSLGSSTVAVAEGYYVWRGSNGQKNYSDTCPSGETCTFRGTLKNTKKYNYSTTTTTTTSEPAPTTTTTTTTETVPTATTETTTGTTTESAPTVTTATTTEPAPTTTTTTTTETTTGTTPISTTASEPIATTTGLLAQQVKIDTELRNHPEILWYPRFDDIAEARKDWSTTPTFTYDDSDGLTGPKLFVVDAPEFGIKAFRSESMSLNPDTRMGSDGSTVWNFRKYFNSNTKEMWTGTAVGNTPLNDLYLRYCIMLEQDVWKGMTEVGVKLSGLSGRVDGNGVTAGGPFWHSKPDAQGRIRLTTYWYGEGLVYDAWGGDWIQGKYLLPNTWHCLEQHLKHNSMNPDGTPNADAILEAWFDDELVYSKKDFVIHRYTGPLPIEINHFHGQIFHGGNATPSIPIHWRMTGVALAKRRIGMPQRQQ